MHLCRLNFNFFCSLSNAGFTYFASVLTVPVSVLIVCGLNFNGFSFYSDYFRSFVTVCISVFTFSVSNVTVSVLLVCISM